MGTCEFFHQWTQTHPCRAQGGGGGGARGKGKKKTKRKKKKFPSLPSNENNNNILLRLTVASVTLGIYLLTSLPTHSSHH